MKRIRQNNAKLRKLSTILAICITVLIALSGCSSKNSSEKTPISDSAFLLDTVCTITIYDSDNKDNIQKAFDEIKRLESILNVDKAGSDLDKLYRNAGIQWTTIEPETLELLKISKKYSNLSEGYFDITAGPLISVWNIKDGKGHYPSDQEREDAMKLIRNKDLKIDEKEQKAYLTQKRMKANLGAIAKGYIADKVKEKLISKGVKSAVINLGGNVITIGSKPNGDPFAVGIQNPNKETGKVLGLLEIKDMSLVSSGINERYFLYNGKRYHHILDPFTGYPSDNGLAGVTILSKKSVDGDGLSTSVFLLGLEKGKKLIESLSDTEAIFITTDNEIIPTSGLEGKIIPYEN